MGARVVRRFSAWGRGADFPFCGGVSSRRAARAAGEYAREKLRGASVVDDLTGETVLVYSVSRSGLVYVSFFKDGLILE